MKSGGITKKCKPKPKSSWTGWGVILGGRNLRCVFGKDELDLAENEAGRYLNAEVARVKVMRVTKKKRRAAATAHRRARSEDS